MGGQVVIVKLSGRNHAKPTNMLDFLVLQDSNYGFHSYLQNIP